MTLPDTIFAVSSGAPPAAIGIVRISGPNAYNALTAMTGRAVPPRRASLATLRNASGDVLDRALVLWFPGPHSATGEDCAELHCHGGRAVLAAVCAALEAMADLRPAEPGEFTRRAFANGRIDLAEAEGLADLLEAETELQRAAAIVNASGALSGMVARWRDAVLALSAQVEAALDFSDEDDVAHLPDDFTDGVRDLLVEIDAALIRPRSERLGEGFRVALAGPPNAGKSTLFNALVDSEAAITSPIAGTTRDVIERAVAIKGVPIVVIDTAGLRPDASDDVEAIGIARARAAAEQADLILWLGAEADCPVGALDIEPRLDDADRKRKRTPDHRVSAKTGQNIDSLKSALVAAARLTMPKPGEAALNDRQHRSLVSAAASLRAVLATSNVLIQGEELRQTRQAFDRLTGRSNTDDMLDALFGRFCIGK